MSFRLTVRGGAAAWPNPGQGCSAYLVEHADTKLLLDCGPDTLLELRKHTPLADVGSIVISHCHADHILDLVTYRYALVYSPDKPSHRVRLWVPPGGTRILEMLGDALGSQGEKTGDFWGEVFDLREYDPTARMTLDDLELEFKSTQHFTACFAIKVESPDGRKLVYGADTGNVDDLIEFACAASLLIAEATADSHEGIERESRGHLVPEDAGVWAARADVGRLLLTHLWYERDAAEVVERAARQFDGPIDVAIPGLTLYV